MNMRLVVKVSKLCNLRCAYCYETPERADKKRMALEDIERMFVHIRDYLWKWGKKPSDHMLQLIWHGGEPFAQPVAYWEGIKNLEKKVFGPRFQRRAIINCVQTNLTLVNEKHLPLIRNFFKVGFSYDVINDLRVNIAGKPTGEVVKKKVEWLHSERISLGAVAVISKSNVHKPWEVARYFMERYISFRALHIFYALDTLPGAREAAVPFESSLQFFKALYDLAEVKKSMKIIDIEPLCEAETLLKDHEKQVGLYPSKKMCCELEAAFGVNTNGDVYSPGDVYNPEFKYGNIFKDTFEEFLSSEGRQRRIKKSQERLEKICNKRCPFFRKGCYGKYVSHSTPEEYRDFGRVGTCHYAWLARMMQKEAQSKNGARNMEGSRPSAA